MASKRLI